MKTWLESSLVLTDSIQTDDLLHRPAEAAGEPSHDLLQTFDEALDMPPERFATRRFGIRRRPTLAERHFDVGDKVVEIRRQQLLQGGKLERSQANVPALIEEVARDPVRDMAAEGLLDLLPFPFRSAGSPCVLVKSRDDRGMHMLRHHLLVAQIEGRRVDLARKQLQRIREVGAVMRDRTAVRQVDGHAMAPPCTAGPLPIVRG